MLLCSLAAWLTFVYAVRTLIGLALYYKGYLFDPMGKPSPATKAFMVGFVRFVANLCSLSSQ